MTWTVVLTIEAEGDLRPATTAALRELVDTCLQISKETGYMSTLTIEATPGQGDVP